MATRSRGRAPQVGNQCSTQSVCMDACLSIFSKTVHPIDVTLGRCVAEDPKKCSVEWEAVWMNGS